MEYSSKVVGQAEECLSSESGWTMYIGDDNDGSSDHNGDDDDREEDEIDDHDDCDGEDSDDSMASDASSGPIQCGSAVLKREDRGVLGFEKKVKKLPLMEKEREGRKEEKEEKEGLVLMDRKVKAPFAHHSAGGMARKNISRFGKRN